MTSSPKAKAWNYISHNKPLNSWRWTWIELPSHCILCQAAFKQDRWSRPEVSSQKVPFMWETWKVVTPWVSGPGKEAIWFTLMLVSGSSIPRQKKALLSVAFSKLQQKTKLKPFLWGDITAKMKHVLIRKRLCTLWKNKRENCENIWFYVCHVCLEYNISWFCNRQIQIDLNFSMLDNYQKHAIHMETHSSLPLGSDYH